MSISDTAKPAGVESSAAKTDDRTAHYTTRPGAHFAAHIADKPRITSIENEFSKWEEARSKFIRDVDTGKISAGRAIHDLTALAGANRIGGRATMSRDTNRRAYGTSVKPYALLCIGMSAAIIAIAAVTALAASGHFAAGNAITKTLESIR